MNIFEYDLNNLDIEEVARLFEIFKENSEKEGHIAIAIPKDQTIYQDVDKQTLYDIRDIIDNELKKRWKKEKEEYRKSKLGYIGKCFECEKELIKIIDFDFNNQYAMKCLSFDWSEGEEDFIFSLENVLLFSKDPKNLKQEIIERYKEISEEEFRQKLKTKIDEICFREYKCQD